MRAVGIISKPKPEDICPLVPGLLDWLAHRKLRALFDQETARCLGRSDGHPREEIPRQVDLLVVLGGDGTLLAAARLVDEHKAPILGVNLGALGFLTEITLDELYPVLEDVLAGRHHTSRRRMLEAEVRRGETAVASYRALNDAVLHKAALARMIDYAVAIDGAFVSLFRADGLIISTPTGSTAYSLAAGGPVVFPSLDAFLITPICPHMLSNRPLVIPDTAEIQVQLKSAAESVYLTVDGQVGMKLRDGDQVAVRKSNRFIELVTSPERNYFELLRNKLRWGEHH
ncbi:MAG: NAD(+)/NADH kinase [Terriglobia bacterium]